VVVTTVMDNVVDLFMPDQGPAHRVGLRGTVGRRPATLMASGDVAGPGSQFRVRLAIGCCETYKRQ
jgi:hypothetical protein